MFKKEDEEETGFINKDQLIAISKQLGLDEYSPYEEVCRIAWLSVVLLYHVMYSEVTLGDALAPYI